LIPQAPLNAALGNARAHAPKVFGCTLLRAIHEAMFHSLPNSLLDNTFGAIGEMDESICANKKITAFYDC
jgi:hypothetical protein